MKTLYCCAAEIGCSDLTVGSSPRDHNASPTCLICHHHHLHHHLDHRHHRDHRLYRRHRRGRRDHKYSTDSEQTQPNGGWISSVTDKKKLSQTKIYEATSKPHVESVSDKYWQRAKQSSKTENECLQYCSFWWPSLPTEALTHSRQIGWIKCRKRKCLQKT